MTQPQVTCRKCGSDNVHIKPTNGQDVVRCLDGCGYSHCAPRTETGREVRSLRTRPQIKPKVRARILDRDNGTCIICHRSDLPLDAGHLISVDEGRELGMTDVELYDEENLAAMCNACNSGYGTTSINPRILLGLIRTRINRRGGTA